MSSTRAMRVVGTTLTAAVMFAGGTFSAAAAPSASISTRAVSAVVPMSGGIINSSCTSTNLRYGSRGDCVLLLQYSLNMLFGAGLATDGSYGPATTAAVYAFQARYGLTYDGKTGPQTWSRLQYCEYRMLNNLPY